MRIRILVLVVLAVAGADRFDATNQMGGPSASSSRLSIKITSPLGRSGLFDKIRIVAMVAHGGGGTLGPVRFFADDHLLGAVSEGPPYAIEWSDENPFEARELSVEVSDSDGEIARDRIKLEPLRVTETSDVASVVLDVAVNDRTGRAVRGLGAKDFHLLEDGVPQTLDQVTVDQRPATFTLLVDSSQSMARAIDSVRAAADSFVRHLRPDDRVVVAPFSKTLGAVTGPTTDRRTVEDAISRIDANGGTAILDALKSIGRRLSAESGFQAVVLLTDGFDEHSTIPLDDAIAEVRTLHAPLYVLGIPGSAGISLKGEDFLRGIASRTGGRAFFPSRDWQYDFYDGQVAEEVQQRYVVAYTPTNQHHDGAWRRLELSTARPEWLVRTRPGYFAAAPAPIRPSIEFTLMNTRRELLAVAADDLVVREDGVEQTLEAFEEALAPVSMVLALDSSGSMRRRAAEAQAAARSFVSAVRPEDKLSVTTFGETITFHHEFTNDRAPSYAAIDAYRAAGGTPLYDDLYQSFQRLGAAPGRRVAVVVTDGRDEDNPGTGPGSVHTFAQVLDAMKQADVTVFAIGIGSQIDRNVLEELASRSGGEAYFPDDVSQLEAQYKRVVENLRHRYVVSYTSTNARHDGTWRSVEIASRIPDTSVATKGGYFAPRE
jgi:Ca-activated chloride channel homolog